MTFSELKTHIYFLTKTNSTSFPIADLTLLANIALKRVVSLILTADGRWKWDDSNQSDLPIATTTITSGQQDYAITTSYIKLESVLVKDQQGNWVKLEPIDRQDPQYEYLTTQESTTGAPMYYDMVGNSMFLYPTPNYTQAASLKLHFARPPVDFTTADTTNSPGIDPLYHDLISLWVSYQYATANGLPTAQAFYAEIQRKELALKEAYGRRQPDDAPQLTMARVSHR